MTEEILSTSNKKLSDESKRLLDKLGGLAETATRLIPETYVHLREDGFTVLEARELIQERIQVSERHLRRLLPEEAKDVKQVRTSSRRILADKWPRLASDTPPVIEIPAPTELVIDLYKGKLDADSRKALWGPKANVKLYVRDGVVERVE
jgi:hypothetical protein